MTFTFNFQIYLIFRAITTKKPCNWITLKQVLAFVLMDLVMWMQGKSFQNLFQSKYEDEADFQDSGGMQGRITRARKLMSQKQWIPSAIK